MTAVAGAAIPEFGAAPGTELLVLFVLVLLDSLGVPAPGDSALILAGGLAAEGRLAVPSIIAVASVAAFLGDLVAFEVGRRGGRRILERDGRLAAHRRDLLARADAFAARHGVAAVLLAKFIPGVRAVSAVSAGATRMSRRTFAAVNALACLTWTSAVVAVAYAAGPTGALMLVGLGLVLAVASVLVGLVRRQRRRARAPEPSVDYAAP